MFRLIILIHLILSSCTTDFEKAEKSFKDEDYDQARFRYLEIDSTDINYPKAKDRLKEIDHLTKNSLQVLIEQAISERRYEDAKALRLRIKLDSINALNKFQEPIERYLISSKSDSLKYLDERPKDLANQDFANANNFTRNSIYVLLSIVFLGIIIYGLRKPIAKVIAYCSLFLESIDFRNIFYFSIFIAAIFILDNFKLLQYLGYLIGLVLAFLFCKAFFLHLKRTILLPREAKDSIRILKEVGDELSRLNQSILWRNDVWNEIEHETRESIIRNKDEIVNMNKVKNLPLRYIVLSYILGHVESQAYSDTFKFHRGSHESIYKYVAQNMNAITQTEVNEAGGQDTDD